LPAGLTGASAEKIARLGAGRGNSAAVPLFSGKIPLLSRFNSAVPQHSGIGSQTIDLT
jgi:hypothetical protein